MRYNCAVPGSLTVRCLSKSTRSFLSKIECGNDKFCSNVVIIANLSVNVNWTCAYQSYEIICDPTKGRPTQRAPTKVRRRKSADIGAQEIPENWAKKYPTKDLFGLSISSSVQKSTDHAFLFLFQMCSWGWRMRDQCSTLRCCKAVGCNRVIWTPESYLHLFLIFRRLVVPWFNE